MTRNFLLLIVGIFILLGIMLFYLLVGTEDTRYTRTMHSLNQMQKLLVQLDKTYAAYFESICDDGTGIIKLDNAENLFESIESWKNEREKIINIYSKSYFGFNTTSIRVFGGKEEINILSDLDNKLRQYNVLANDVLKNGISQCEVVNKKPDKDYMEPVKSKTCLVKCQYLYRLRDGLLEFKHKDRALIDETLEKLSKKDE